MQELPILFDHKGNFQPLSPDAVAALDGDCSERYAALAEAARYLADIDAKVEAAQEKQRAAHKANEDFKLWFSGAFKVSQHDILRAVIPGYGLTDEEQGKV